MKFIYYVLQNKKFNDYKISIKYTDCVVTIIKKGETVLVSSNTEFNHYRYLYSDFFTYENIKKICKDEKKLLEILFY